MDRLVSKIFAGGISAGVFLIWWPQHVHSEDLVHLVVRGLLWTLTFELLLVSFGPAEDVVRARVNQRLERRRGLVRLRFANVPAPARVGGTLALACMGLALPALLLAGGPTELVKADEPTKVVKQVVVERPVIERKVVVRRVVERTASAGAAPSVAQTAPATTVAPAAKPAAQQRTRVVAEKATDATPAPKTVAAPKAQSTETTATATEPAAPAAPEAPAAQPLAAADTATTPQP